MLEEILRLVQIEEKQSKELAVESPVTKGSVVEAPEENKRKRTTKGLMQKTLGF